MANLFYSNRFKKDVKLCQKQGRDMDKLKAVMGILLSGKPIPPQYKDHPLSGKWKGFRDLHIEPDWLLVYYVDKAGIYLSATGSHAYILKM